MIELADGIFISPEHVSMIKSAGEDKCVLYTVGQSALDGHILDYPASQVAEVINDYLGEDDVEEEDEEE
jgi:hypothetical protein